MLALLLASIAILSSWAITKLTFSQMLGTVKQLTATNPKLQLVNRIFRDVVQLEQLQREQALEPEGRKHNPFFNESNNIRLMLDSLYIMCIDDSQQVTLVKSMKEILHERDKIYLNYLAMRTEYVNNDTLTRKLKSLTEMLNNPVRNTDSNIITTQSKKITTTTIVPADDIKRSNKSLWDKVFGKKKTDQKPNQQIKEEVNITTDTLKVPAVDTTLVKLSETIASAEISRSNKRKNLINRQLQLDQTGNVFMGQLLQILTRMEQEETLSAQQKNHDATVIVNRNLWWMNLLIIIFIGGAALLTFMILTDIIKSNRYKKELIVAKEEAEEAGRVKQRFLSNMSHELRTPLQAIVGMAEQVNMKGQAEQKDINMIYQSSQHLLQIVNEVLDYSLITSGKIKLEEKTFNPGLLLEEVKNVMTVKAAEKKLDLIYEAKLGEDINLSGDPFRLKQLLYNLLGNAIKFTETGSVTLRAEQKKFNAYCILSIIVKDTGRGISIEDLSRIFNQFEQGSAPLVLQQQGTGLGLSIVQSLIEQLKGTIQVESEPGQGSTFTISIPYSISRDIIQQATTDAAKPVDNNIGTVWVIDDDPLILQLCDYILQKHDIKHRCFSSPAEMVNTIRKHQPDIILMDIRMPEMTGFELLQKLKPSLPASTRVYALTAHALPDDREDILRPGFNDLLMKPFMEQDLLHILGTTSAIDTVASHRVPELDALYKMTGGDEGLVQQVLHQFVTETQKDNDELHRQVQQNKLHNAAELLHKLAGRCGQVGFKEVAADARTAEVKIRNGQAEDMIPALTHIHNSVSDAIARVNEYLQATT